MTPFEEKLFQALINYNRNMPIGRAIPLIKRETSGEPTIGTEHEFAKVKFTGMHFEFTI